MSTAEPPEEHDRGDHVVLWWLAVITVIFGISIGLAFKQISEHFDAQQKQDQQFNRALIDQQKRALMEVRRRDCAQTTARWFQSRAVVLLIVQPYPFPPAAFASQAAIFRVVNQTVKQRQAAALRALGTKPRCASTP